VVAKMNNIDISTLRTSVSSGQIDMTCFYCMGNTEQSVKTHAVTLDRCGIIIKSVPALVCTQGGEVYFQDDTMQRLEEIVDKLENIIKEVAIIDYADVAA
jgi:YgiT-type zinc finger domain-containing protein